MKIVDAHGETTAFELLVSGARTSTVTGTGVDIRPYQGALKIVLNSAAGSGTSPTLDVKIQDSEDGSSYADVSGAVFAQVTTTASTQSIRLDTRRIRRLVRVVGTIGGTSPSFNFAVIAVGQTQVI